MSSSQDIPDRRMYVIKPRLCLIKKITPFFSSSGLEFVEKPNVVMTEELPFEQHLEGWRAVILKKCKEAFIKEQMEYGIFCELEEKDLGDLLGSTSDMQECFDKWWLAEETADWIEIPMNWKD